MKIFLYLIFISLALSSCEPNLNTKTTEIDTWSINTTSWTISEQTNSWNLINDNQNNMNNSYQTSKLENWDIVAIMTTTNWTIKIKLFPKDVPNTVNNFVWLAKKWYYNWLIFHRVINNFMIQWWDPEWTWMWWESIYWPKFEDEFSSKLSNISYSISMANSWPNTNGSQFFINQKDNTYLDNKHSVFWQVYEWIDNVDKIAKTKTWANDKPEKDIKIISLEIKKYDNWNLLNYDVKLEDLIKVYKDNIEKKKNEEKLILEKKKEENKNRVIKKGDLISVNYTWKFSDWKVFDTSLKEWRTPLEFTVWDWNMIKWFDSWVVWMKIWEKKTLTLKPVDAYWEYDDTKIQEVPKKDLKSFTDAWIKLEKWVELPTQMWKLKIKEVKKDSVVIDLNSEMAWKTLIFDIEIVDFKN